ncbi:MAG: P1 family peptidase [Coriobacteriales bacterium]|jgi:L-aminopeptidase/D-esterase-like protein|nr:P1 family peptidase [Coriobacteriales bacterium]
MSAQIRSGAQTLLPAGFLLGHAEDNAAATGCSVILCEAGAVGGVAVRGGAPATRETDLLDPANSVQAIHAVVLCGGSAFGLAAAGGVAEYLAGRRVGFELGGHHVPIVCAAALFDLTCGDGSRLPDAPMGIAACNAARPEVAMDAVGAVGAGRGATVGKLLGPELSMPGGFGAASVTVDTLVVSAVVAVNACGSVFDPADNRPVAGVRNPRMPEQLLSRDELLEHLTAVAVGHQPPSNTTIGCLMTNACLSKPQVHRVASMAHDALARTIAPAHMSMDGDTLFAMACGDVPASPDLIGYLGTCALEAAILDAVS